MDKKFRFTQLKIEKLPLPIKGRVDYYDIEQPKLSCRVSQTGNKSFVVIKKSESGSVQRITLGKFPDMTVHQAREGSLSVLNEIRQGINPMAEKRKRDTQKTTLAECLNQYLAERKLKLVTVNGYKYILKNAFSDWKDKPVNKITENMVLNRHKKLSKVGGTTANNSMRVLRLTLNYACAIGVIENPPTSILNNARLWHKNKRKSRVIPSDQLKQWYDSVNGLKNHKAKTFLLMLLYMGLRSSEARYLKWENVNLRKKIITVLDTKNGTDHTLPIPGVLVPYIKELKLLTGKHGFVFSGDTEDDITKVRKAMSVPKRSILTVIDQTGVEFSPHDCRRTFATIAEAVNLPLTMIKRLMNHVTTNDVTGGYIVTEEETLRAAINKIAIYIQARVTHKDNVIKLRATK